MSNGNQTNHYLTQIRVYPVNVSIPVGLDMAGADLPCRIALEDPRLPGPVELTSQTLESFSFNERGCIQVVTRLNKSSGDDFGYLTIMVLPVGTVATILTRRLEATPPFGDLAALHHEGERSFSHSNGYSGLVYDLLSALERKAMLSHASVAPLDVFQVVDQKKKEIVDRKKFVDIMEWRAWGSGGYVSIQRSGDEHQVHSNSAHEDGKSGAFQSKRALIPCQNGVVWAPYENCYVWQINHDPEQFRHFAPDVNPCPTEDECYQETIRRAVEPLLYAVSLRSICASGMSNVRTITRAFAGWKDSQIRIGDLRRYIGETRLSVLAVKEYEESSDKFSRAIYRKVSDDIRAEQSASELRRNLVDVADEIQVVQNERAEAKQGRLNSFAFLLTVLFGISAMVDLITFIEAPMPNWSLEARIISLAGYGIALGLALIVIRILPGRY